MKILYCLDSLKASGGTERVLTTKLNWLVNKTDIDIWIVKLYEEESSFFTLSDKVKIIELPVKHSEIRAYIGELNRTLTKIKPDVTVAVAGMAVDVLPLMKDGSKKVLEFHYTKNFLLNFVNGINKIRFRKLHLLKMHFLQWKLARTARRYDMFVGLTSRDVGLWGHPKNMTYVHNPLSFRSERKSTCRSKTIIAVGSWTPAKGMDQLLEAFGPLSTDYPDWSVELYGAGQDEQRLRQIIAKYNMGAQVKLNSPVRDIARQLCEASIYAFPSRSDGFGLVITEAMECGLPTVAMDCPCGPCEIITPTTGIVVDDGNIVAFRSALKTLMDDPKLRISMGHAATVEVKRFYTDTIMPRWVDLFNNLCS